MSQTETPTLFAAHEPVFPRRVSGRYRRLKWWIMGVTLAIYYLTPWIRWDRGPDLPDQAVLVDLAHRRFWFFWIEIWPHEFYFVAGLLIMAGFGLFLFTSALGRVWCGYTCPQTVWTDLFILVERWIEGDRNARVKLWNAPWSARKARLRLTKWIVWLLIAAATGGAWVFYFTDAATLARDLVTLQAPAIAWTTIAILTATTFVLGGFMREQVCIYMCPWPRIQGAMMDDRSLTVSYREWRGEPRGKGNVRRRSMAEALQAEAISRAAGPGEARYPSTPYPDRARQVGGEIPAGAPAGPGDCIDCMACVNVCPMGIDIRNGQQLECITCALCIDACDDVMAKIGKPRGLIDYIALSDEAAERGGQPPQSLARHVFRPRTLIYTGLWALVGVGLVVALFLRSELGLTVAPVRNPTFVTLADGSVRNTYVLRLRNQTGGAADVTVSLGAEETGLQLALEGEPEGDTSVTVPVDEVLQVRAYITAPADDPRAVTSSTDIRLWAASVDGARASRDTSFNGKGLQ